MILLPTLAPVYRVTILVLTLLCVSLGLGLALAKARMNTAIAERETAVQEFSRLREAAKGSERTIKELTSANKALVSALAAQQRAYDAAAAEIEPLKQLAESQARKLRERERIDRATPKCQLVLNTDVGGACPALADGVRQRADRRLPGSTG
jgi:chromosome segregation ATPase